ncbi:protein FAM71B-like isoform X2 [Meleagris gallopavo]|uniref:protein FAM71B-like isoform X2 n=1 Tax=Meleagris gallopavo TaxID=9103 RepID=UPI000549C0B1|nr:protein FAM71B-like isoform X2 [Meleagris gallopavo]
MRISWAGQHRFPPQQWENGAGLFQSKRVSRQGEVLNVSKHAQVVTMGVAETGPAIGVPNVILMAVPADSPAKGLELTRLLPLQCVKLTVYSGLQHCLRLRFPTGRKVYLQLFPGPRARELFLHWAVLVTMLPVPGMPCIHRTPAEEPAPRGEACSVSMTEAKVEAKVKVSAMDLSMDETLTIGETAETDKAPPASSTPEDVPNETSADAMRRRSNEYLDTLATTARKMLSSGWLSVRKWAFWRRGCRGPRPTPTAGAAH